MPGATYTDAVRTFASDLGQWREETDRIVDLFLRLPNMKQPEIAPTVHFAATELAWDVP
jgi:hypothetical protein